MYSLIVKSDRLSLSAFCLLICICLCGVTAVAQDEGAQTTEVESQEILTGIERKLQKTVVVEANELSIDLVMRQLIDQTDVNLVIGPNVVGEVTVSLTDVTLKDALESILSVHGAAYIPGDNIIRILPIDEIPKVTEMLVTETFQIKHVDAAEVVIALEKFISKNGAVSHIKGSSYIIVTDTKTKIRDIANLLNKIDGATPQVLVEVRIYDVTSKDHLDLGVEWSAGRRTNRDATGRAIGDDITVEKGGVDTFVNSITDPSLTGGVFGGTGKTADSTQGFLRFGLLNDSIEVDALLRAEQEDIDAKLLANPRILVVDNLEAVFDIVTQHPYVERTITGATVTETVQFKDVGVKLTVTPHITTNGSVRMHIMPEFGIVIGQVQVASSNVPIVDLRKFDTTAVVKDGHTVVLGGLRKKDTTLQTNKVPILGDIPILGRLFRFEGEATTVNELVIFITPRIIEELTMSESEQEAYGVTEFSGPRPVRTKHEKSLDNE
jgi:type IV pilus assembly protein PilQ